MASPYRPTTKKVSLQSCKSTGRPRSQQSEGRSDPIDCRHSASSQCRIAYTSWCPVCSSDNKTQCGRRRSKNEGLEADPLREHNGAYESFSVGLAPNCRLDFVRETGIGVYNSRPSSDNTQNQTSRSLPSCHHNFHRRHPELVDVDGNMDPVQNLFISSPSKNYTERSLPSNHLHQQRLYEACPTITVAQGNSFSEVNENPKHFHSSFDNGFAEKSFDRDQRGLSPKQGKNTKHSLSSSNIDQKNYYENSRRTLNSQSEHIQNRHLNHIAQSRRDRDDRSYNGTLDKHYDNRNGIEETGERHSAVGLQDRYYREMEVLRNKLCELRGADGKRIRQSSESDLNNAPTITSPQKLTWEPKRARDISPKSNVSVFSTYHEKAMPPVISHRSSGIRAKLPMLPTYKGNQNFKANLLQDKQETQNGDQASVSSYSNSDDGEQDCCEDFEGKGEPEEDSEEDNQSVKSSLTTVSSSGSNASGVVRMSMGSISLNDVAVPRSAVPLVTRNLQGVPESLRPSLFSYVPPYIQFTLHDAPKGNSLPVEIHRLLKWKLSTITPLVVRRTLVNTGYRLVRKSNDWCGTWGKHMKSLCFKTLKDFQKINHFPGTFQIGRKDRLWKNLHRLMVKFGKKEFGFIPRTYVLPQDNKLLRAVWEKSCGKEKWIIKPPASARGTGIKVVHRWNEIPKKRPLVVQKYIAQPYLINGSKFDLRLYVLVTSINPLRIYMYEDGLVRFASVKYSEDTASLGDRFMHLTNYSINKLSSQYTANEDSTACQGHKWTVKALWTYLAKQGVDVTALWASLVDMSIKTLISGESAINQLTRANLNSRYAAYELFGIDVLLDVDLKPWLLEVNISPSLHSASPLDLVVKGPMVRDLMNMAGYQIPSKLQRPQQTSYLEAFGLRQATSHLCFDKRLYTMVLSKQERAKHMMHQQTSSRSEYLEDILRDLTPDDVRHLIQSEDELTQAGGFTRVFPTTSSHSYHEYFESPRYYNMLFDAWEHKYHANRQEGINLLESKCLKKYHLTIPVPGGAVKSYGSQSNHSLNNSTGWEDLAETKPTADRKVLSLSSMSLYRATRPRSGKFGVSGRPYSRSVYLTRKQKSSTLPTSLAKCSSLDFEISPTSTVIEENGTTVR